MSVGDRLHDSETQSRSGGACREEWLEDFRLDARRDARTVVPHPQLDTVAAKLGIQGDHDFGRSLESVAHQVGQRRHQRRSIAFQFQQDVRTLDDQMCVRRFQRCNRFVDLAEQIGDPHPLTRAVAPSEYQHVPNQLIETMQTLDAVLQ